MKRTTLTILLLLNLLVSFGQGKPVTALISLTPPYSPFLSEYASAITNRLQLTLIVNDSRLQNYPVKLQMFIERPGSGIVMRTGEYATIPPILLNGGTTEVLSGASLSPYFLAQNNIFSGFDQSQYLQTGRIPDGQYRIGFQVVDARRSEVKLSALVFSQPGWFLLNDPPQLNLPRNNTTERVNDPQSIKLEWFPRHLGSMNSAFATSYQVELFALRVPGMNPNQVALSLPPVFTAVTNQNRFTLSQDKYMLEPGVEYAWRVKAMAGDGFTLFQNKGYSEVFSFVYGQLCPVPQNTNAEVQGYEKATIGWNTDPLATSWEVRFRKQGQEDAIWHSRESFTGGTEIANVFSAGTAYEYQVRAKCTNNRSDYSPLKTFTTQELPPPVNFDCGKDDTAKVTNFTPKLELKPGDIIYNGEFPVKLTEVEGGSGNFKGKGRMRVPMLANIQINMQFTGLKVNEENQVYGGEMVSVYNENSPFFIEDLSDYFGEGDQIGNIISGQDSAAIILDYVVDDPNDIDVTIDGNTVTVTGSGGSTVVTIDDGGSGTTIVDSDGNIYAVDGNGNVTTVGTSGGNVSNGDYNNTLGGYNQLNNDLVVTFANNENSTWAFDERKPAYEGSLFDGEYEKIGDYYVPWKFVPLGKSDKITARITAGSVEDNKKLKFLTPTGTEFLSEYKDGQYFIEVIGGKERDGLELFAIYMPDDSTKISAGKLKIASYPQLEMKVKLVPMGDFHIDGIISENILNEIYRPYYIHWQITIDKEFTDKSWDANEEGLQSTGSGFWSEFSPEMRALNAAYQEERGIDEESLYLFVFPDGNSEGGLLGDMPLKSRFGYIFNADGADTRKITQTVAHELGHGAFQLKHTFSDKYGIEKNTTDNLMDYNGGTELVKYQWDVVHDPQNKLFNWMQGEEEGQQGERPEIPINRKIIVAWLKDQIQNKSQSVSFTAPNFYFDPYHHDIEESKNAILMEVSTPLQIRLNNSGILDFQAGNNNFAIAISIPGLGQETNYGSTKNLPKESDYHTSFYLYFNYKDKSGPAIILYTYSYIHFERLLIEIGMNISNLKERISAFYEGAIGIAGNDCDKLDVIFETIPNFVLDKLSDDSKWSYLKNLMGCSKGNYGTKEHIAIANLIENISATYIYEKINQNKKLFRELIDDASDDNLEYYISAFNTISDNIWTDQDLENVGITYAKMFEVQNSTEGVELEFGEDYLRFSGLYNSDASDLSVTKFKLGRRFSAYDYEKGPVFVRENIIEEKNYEYFEPIKVRFEEEYDIIMPAFLAWEIVKRNAPASVNMQVLQFCTNLLLIENTIAKPKWFTRLFKIKIAKLAEELPVDFSKINLNESGGIYNCFHTTVAGDRLLNTGEAIEAINTYVINEARVGNSYISLGEIYGVSNWNTKPFYTLDQMKSFMKAKGEGSTFVIAAFKGGLPQHAFNGVVKNGKVYFPDFQKNWYWNEMGGKNLSDFFSKYRIIKTN